MKKLLVLSKVLLVAALAGCSPAEAPATPSWDQDVFPILQGSCNHCHGETVGQDGNQKFPSSRLDICSKDPFDAAMISVLGPALIGAGPYSGTLTDVLTVKPGAKRPLMPPPPASPLSDYERDVLLKWAKIGGLPNACAKKGKNRPPTAKATQKFEGDSLAVTLEVTDPDGDTVLGKVRAGSAPDQTIIASGRRTYFFQGLSVGSPVKVLLHDGYEKVDLDL